MDSSLDETAIIQLTVGAGPLHIWPPTIDRKNDGGPGQDGSTLFPDLRLVPQGLARVASSCSKSKKAHYPLPYLARPPRRMTVAGRSQLLTGLL